MYELRSGGLDFNFTKCICFEPIQNGTSFEQRSLMKFLVAEKCKPCEIYRRMIDIYGETSFGQKMFTNELNMDLPLLWVQVKKTVHRMETLWLSVKEKVLAAAVNKEGSADLFWDTKRNHYYWFPWKWFKCKLLPITNSLGKINFIYWMTLVLIPPPSFTCVSLFRIVWMKVNHIYDPN